MKHDECRRCPKCGADLVFNDVVSLSLLHVGAWRCLQCGFKEQITQRKESKDES